MLIDQRDIQRLGGKASKYPASYMVSNLLDEVNARAVLDVTYGVGRFYAYRRPEFLVGCDPEIWNWIVAPDIFIKQPVWRLKDILSRINVDFDVLVCDPPAWDRDIRYNRRGLYSFVIGDSNTIIKEAFKLAADLKIPYLLLHYNKIIQGNWEVIRKIEFRYVARYLNNPDLKTTYFIIYRVVDPWKLLRI